VFNGNMLTGLGGKVITYDAENRPLSVKLGSVLTCYVYGADGGRLKKIVTSGTTCPAQTATGAGVTLYAGIAEYRNWKAGATEQIFLTPMPSIRLAFTTPGSTAYDWTAIHRDPQGSVRGVTSSAGAKTERTIYRPFGNADSEDLEGSRLPDHLKLKSGNQA
jgi:hypothetical protein